MSSIFPVECNSRFTPSLGCFLQRAEVAEVMAFPISRDVGGETCFPVGADALNATTGVEMPSSIPRLLRACGESQIADAVVQPVPIDVVDLQWSGIDTIREQPRDAVSTIFLVIQCERPVERLIAQLGSAGGFTGISAVPLPPSSRTDEVLNRSFAPCETASVTVIDDALVYEPDIRQFRSSHSHLHTGAWSGALSALPGWQRP